MDGKTVVIAASNRSEGEQILGWLDADLHGILVETPGTLRRQLEMDAPRAILLDDRFGPGGGRSILRDILGASPGAALIVILDSRDPAEVLDWLASGAFGYLQRPLDAHQFQQLFQSLVHRPIRGSPVGPIEVHTPVQGWVELSAPSDSEFLPRFQHFFEQLHATQLDEADKRQLQMAVFELGQNAIEWGNRREVQRRVQITYCLFEDRIVFKIEDEGEGFAPDQIPDPTEDPLGVARARMASGKRAGGYGLVLIKRLMDHVMYSEKGNTVLFEKQFRS